MTKLLQQCFLFFIVVVIPGHNLGNGQVSVNRTIGPTLVLFWQSLGLSYNYFDALSLCFISDSSIISEKETLSWNGGTSCPLSESL